MKLRNFFENINSNVKEQGMAEGSDNLSYIGNCTDDDVIEHIFGDATNFAQAVEEHGDEFTIDDLVVKYDPESDVHSFYYKKQGVAEEKQRLDPKCWKGYKKQGTKMKGGVRVNNCVKEAKQALAKHVKEGVPLPDSLFRYQSEAYFDTFKYAKQLREAGILQELDWESEEMLATDIGESVVLKGVGRVWLDVPYLDESADLEEGPIRNTLGAIAVIASLWGVNNHFAQQAYENSAQLQKLTAYLEVAKQHNDQRMIDQLEDRIEAHKDRLSLDMGDVMGHDGRPIEVVYDKEGIATPESYNLGEAEYQGKDVELNKPKRGGSKKYYVYVKNPSTGNIKKISFGDVTGLRTKSGNAKRAKSFAARHNCEKKNDKMKAGYWACRLPRYGLVKGGKWW